ncbi:transcriptional regulator [Bacteroides sp. K03]|uniref:UpxZ family transcription anti-terminator antagonist n=1 Tax=unclassified Bacteroides TaxID=2646097 RepID=UPI001C8BA272|nr:MULTISPECIES: UpxZ family transcription anti-terminator antagonist [unclassified Bacteroides]MBX9187268.1 transcriptional regulator [Bacteroides sp. K03]
MNKTEELQQLAQKSLYLGLDGDPIYAEHFSRLNKEIQILSDALYSVKGDTPEEEAGICLALLMGYNATIYSDKDKEAKKQSILDRAWEVLEQLPPSLLKCQLLTYCYGEVFEEELAQEAHAIIDSWQGRELTAKEQEVVENLRNLEENQYPYSDFE